MNFKSYFLLGLVVMMAATACKKGSNPSPGPVIDTDVYLSGNYIAKNGNSVVAYWKNGIPTKLSDSTLSNSYATGMAVDGTDVYLTGYYYNSQHIHIPAYWKNDSKNEVRLTLPNSIDNGITTGIALYDHTVYVGGEEISGLVSYLYWQGNASTQLELATANSNIDAIAANENGVYSAGSNSSGVSAYWKGSMPVQAPIDTLLGRPYAISLNGTDVYTAGLTYTPNSGKEVATYWKNGVANYLTKNSPLQSVAACIIIKDDVVYTAGYEIAANGYFVACYWKGMTQVYLTNDTQNAYATGIAVVGKDVYVAGYNYQTGTAVYWKNGVMKSLPGTQSPAPGFAVVTHPH